MYAFVKYQNPPKKILFVGMYVFAFVVLVVGREGFLEYRQSAGPCAEPRLDTVSIIGRSSKVIKRPEAPSRGKEVQRARWRNGGGGVVACCWRR